MSMSKKNSGRSRKKFSPPWCGANVKNLVFDTIVASTCFAFNPGRS
jgi:hypothetical protein